MQSIMFCCYGERNRKKKGGFFHRGLEGDQYSMLDTKTAGTLYGCLLLHMNVNFQPTRNKNQDTMRSHYQECPRKSGQLVGGEKQECSKNTEEMGQTGTKSSCPVGEGCSLLIRPHLFIFCGAP